MQTLSYSIRWSVQEKKERNRKSLLLSKRLYLFP